MLKQNEISQFLKRSSCPQYCERLYREALEFYKRAGLRIKEHQEKALLNHIAEMVRRNKEREAITIHDRSVFQELSTESINQATKIVKQLEHISSDEIYLLAVHFEVAKYN